MPRQHHLVDKYIKILEQNTKVESYFLILYFIFIVVVIIIILSVPVFSWGKMGSPEVKTFEKKILKIVGGLSSNMTLLWLQTMLCIVKSHNIQWNTWTFILHLEEKCHMKTQKIWLQVDASMDYWFKFLAITQEPWVWFLTLAVCTHLTLLFIFFIMVGNGYIGKPVAIPNFIHILG